jgi:uncharacterized protein YbjT (DUF2867 family)
VARCLIIGCGCRGLSLAGRLQAQSHAVRGTTRHQTRVEEIAAAGAEPHVGDPERVATLAAALEHVTVACVLLGSASGASEHLAALHGPRLEMLLSRILDTTIRGVVYEAAGVVDADILHGGARRVSAACERSRIPYALLGSDPTDHAGWLSEADGAVQLLLHSNG